MRRFKIGIKKRLSFLRFKYGKFGKKSLIFKPLIVTGKKNIFIGDNVIIAEFSRIEVISTWNEQKFQPKLEIGNNTHFEQLSHIVCTDVLKIGHDCTISSKVFITTCNHVYQNINQNILSQALDSKEVVIGNNCFIGMDVKIFPGVHIGDNVIVGANSLILEDIPDYSVVVGSPAKVIKKYNFNTKCWEKVKEMK